MAEPFEDTPPVRQRMTNIPATPVAMAEYLYKLGDDIATAEGDIVLLALSVTPAEDPVEWQVQCIVDVEVGRG